MRRFLFFLALVLTSTAAAFAHKWPESGGSVSIPSGFVTSPTQVIATANTTDADITPSPTNIAGLTFPVVIGGHYNVECRIVVSNTDATSGIQLAVQGPAVTSISSTHQSFTAIATLTSTMTNTIGQRHVTTSAQAAGTLGSYFIYSTMRTFTAAGNVTISIDNELAGVTATAHAGSFCTWARTN